MLYGLLFSGAVRAAVVLFVGLIAYALLSHAAAATRRFILVLTLTAAILVPIAATLAPRWALKTPAALSVFAREATNESPASTTPATDTARAPQIAASRPPVSPLGKLDPADAIVLTWVLIGAALLARMAASQLRARAIVRRATPVKSTRWLDAANDAAGDRRVDVRASFEIESPAVIGIFRPAIVVPHDARNWPLDRCRFVLVHELAHIRRRDVLMQALADVACAIHWYNPLVWVCARRLRVEREIAADDVVLAAGVRPSRYAEELVAVATSIATRPATLAMAERSSLEVRVASILASRLARAPLAARGTVGIVAAGAALAAAVACTSPEVPARKHVSEPVAAPRAGTANDAAMQRVADDELAAITTEWSPELATILLLDPSTGEILANAGRSSGKTADVASTVAMAPGSTLKPITIAAALEIHAITVGQKFECGPNPRMYGDKAFHDASTNGTLDIAHILAVSSNIGTSRIFDALGGDNLGLWLHRFHFGESPSTPGSATGALSAHIVTGSYEGAAVATGVGITATPLQMIAAYGAIASDGIYHAPTSNRGGSPAERLVSSDTARSVMALLETAVDDDMATGKAARVEGIHVAGKTGTSEWTAPDGRDRTYASFIGIADLPSRRIVALVGLQALRDDTLSGGKAAAPVFARLMKRIRAI